MVIETTPRRQAIEDVASALFHEHGYAGTSVRDIARALDIRGASLYAHIASKEDVLLAIVERAASTFEQMADRAIAATAGAGVRARLDALVQSHVRVITAEPELASVFVNEWRHLAPQRRQLILLRRDAYQERFHDVISNGIESGDFAATDPALAATFILTALNGIASWYSPLGRLDVDSIASHYAALALAALTGMNPNNSKAGSEA
jgi:TetR/AcrR family transcriptional regulator, cholesterol catabolism regulator